MEIRYSLLENGFDFLVNSINNLNIAREGTTDEDARRLMKYALLNLSSGIELVFKYRLLNENWSYVFADMNRANKKAFQEGDFKSVDSGSNIERLKNLCEISFTLDEEGIIKNLRKKRNRIEHFKIEESIESLEAIMYKSLSLIIKFVAKYLNISAFTFEENNLLEEMKKETLNLKEVVTAREKIIESSAKTDGIFDSLITCPECLKRFLHVEDGENKCLFCYYTDDPENVANSYISNVVGISSYECIKDGVEYPLYECPECEANSLIYDKKEDVEYFCFNCGLSTDSGSISFCSECGNPFYDHEGISICNSCVEYIMSEDD